MAVEVLHYDVKHYNSLAPILIASEQFQCHYDRAEVFGEIAPVFLRHRVEGILGIILLHNHFSLEENQKLVALGNVATPWDVNAVKEMTDVSSTSFRFVNGALAPYEFTHGTGKLPMESEQMQAFLAELLPLLKNRGLDNLLGICALPDIGRDISTEFTSGNANITYPLDLNPGTGSIEAMWHFNNMANTVDCSEPGIPVAVGQCKVRCKIGTEGHKKDHKSNT